MTSSINSPPGVSRNVSSASSIGSYHGGHLRPPLNPTGLSTSGPPSLNTSPSASYSGASTPQRSTSTSSQSSTASMPARPIRPPPIETRTKASRPEQWEGATSLRESLANSHYNNSRGDQALQMKGTFGGGGAISAAIAASNGVELAPEIAGPASRGKSTGFVVKSGHRGTSSGGSGGSSAGARRGSAGASQAIGPGSFRFGEELGRGSYSVVLNATHLASTQSYAVKILDKHHLRTHKKERYASVEVDALKRLTAPPAGHASNPSAGSMLSPTKRPPTHRQRSSGGGAGGKMPASPSETTIRAAESPKEQVGNPVGEASSGGVKEGGEGKKEPVAKKTARQKGGHPGVVRLHWAFQDIGSLYFVLDLVPNGEILSLLRQYGSLSLPSARHYIAELLDVTGWMHEKGIVHRDLKPENILLDANFHIKLTDFGSAKVYPIVEGKVDRSDPKLLPEDLDKPIPPAPKRSFVGTAEYVSPEVLLNERTTEASDFWAIGCILYQLIAGAPPFRGKTEYLTFQKIKALEYTFPDDFDADAQDLIEKLLVLDPNKRLGTGPEGISDIKSHPFFTKASIDFSTLFTVDVPARASGIVGPPEPVRNSFFPSLDGLSIHEEDDEFDPSEDEMDAPPEAPTPEPAEDESDFDEDDLEFVPPKGRWGPHGDRARHGLGTGSVSSGSGSVTSTEQMLTPTTGGMVRPWSTKTTESYGSTNTTTSDGGRSIGLGTPVSGLGAPGTGVQIVHGANGEIKERVVSGPWQSPSAKDNRRCLPLLPDETPIFSSPIFLPASSVLSKSLHLPGSKARERLLVLTDFPRLLCVKQDKHTGVLKVKSECLILRRGTGASRLGPLQVAGGGNVLKGVKEKGSKGFSVQTTQNNVMFLCENEELRHRWIDELTQIQD